MLKKALTVLELIKVLKGLPPDLPVMLEGYEGGYNHDLHFEQKPLALYVHEEDYYGNHEDVEYLTVNKKTKPYEQINAVIIRAQRHDNGENA